MLKSNYVTENDTKECLGGLRIMSDNELLLAISEMMDAKLDARLKPIERRLDRIEDILENNVLPRLNTLERCYTSTYERYKENCDRMEAAFDDICVIKRVVIDHSERLVYLTRTVDKHTEQLERLTQTVDKHTEEFKDLNVRVDLLEKSLEKMITKK